MAKTDHEGFIQDFSGHLEESLPAARAREVADHLAGCAACRAEYERFCAAVQSLSGLHRRSAPQDFEEQVEQAINRRSGGRFFGRRVLGDRLPMEVLAVIVLLLLALIYVLARYSDTGSVHGALPQASRPRAVSSEGGQ